MQIKRFDRKLRNSAYSLFANWKRNLVIVLVFIIVILSLPFLLKSLFIGAYKDKIYDNVNDIPSTEVALVLGAGLKDKGVPSGILEDRVMTAVDLYKQGKVKKIIMSGDNRTTYHDEPSAMIDLAIAEGVRKEDLQPDYAGRRTYDSCYRAREIFSLNELIIVTQDFHMDRAMYICNSLGINAYGLRADKHNYAGEIFFDVRDTFAFTLAIIDVNIRKPVVVLGDKIEI